MATYSNTAREVEMPNGDVVVLHSAPTGGANTTSNIKKFKYDDNGHVTESEAANATDLNLNSYSTPTTGSTAIGTSDAVQTAIGKLDHQSQIDQSNILYGLNTGVKNIIDFSTGELTPSVTTHGITWTTSENKGLVANGTSDSSGSYPAISTLTLPVGTYKLSGGTSRIKFQAGNSIVDSGSGATLTVTSSTPQPIRFVVVANASTTFSNETIYPMLCTEDAWNQSHDYQPPALPNYDLTRGLAELNAHPFLTIPFNHNMVYRGKNLGATLTDAQHTALSSGNFTDLYLGDYWTKTVTIPAGTYTGGDGQEITVPAQTNITLKAVIADFDTFYAGYASTYAGINTHHAAVIVHGFVYGDGKNLFWNGTNSTTGGYVNSLVHKYLVGSVLPQLETWFGSAKVLSHQKLLTNAITGDAASGWAWSSQKISLLSENQVYGSKVWGNSKAANGGYEPGEAFKHLNVFNHIDANLLFGNRNIWLRDIASAVGAAVLNSSGSANNRDASNAGGAPAALILLS